MKTQFTRRRGPPTSAHRHRRFHLSKSMSLHASDMHATALDATDSRGQDWLQGLCVYIPRDVILRSIKDANISNERDDLLLGIPRVSGRIRGGSICRRIDDNTAPLTMWATRTNVIVVRRAAFESFNPLDKRTMRVVTSNRWFFCN